MQLHAERDNFVTAEALDWAIQNGIDPILIKPKVSMHSAFLNYSVNYMFT
jgi:hypothetical protein